MAARFPIAALLVAAASAQTADRTFYAPHVQSTAELQNIVNIVRSVGDIQQVTGDFSKKAINVIGSSDQIAFADWATHELDNPTRGPAPREYRIDAADTSIVRIYYLGYIKTPQEIQEITNAIRSMADVRRFIPCNAAAALIVRGTADQMAAVDWAVHELDRPGPAKTSAEFPLTLAPGQVARIFVVQNNSPQQLQELVNVTRSIADIQRFFPLTAQHAIVARGSAEQIALAAWMLQQLDSPSPAPPMEYLTSDKFNPVVHIVFLPETMTSKALQDNVNAVRSATRMQRVFPSNLRKAIAMRGTADQISRAELMLKEPVQ